MEGGQYFSQLSMKAFPYLRYPSLLKEVMTFGSFLSGFFAASMSVSKTIRPFIAKLAE
jgi:hypothetical protein